LLNGSKQLSLKLLLVSQVAFWLRFGVNAPVLALFVRGVGATVTEIGLLWMIEAVGWAIFEPIFGLVADRFGKKRLAIYSIVTTSIVYMAFTFAPSIWHFYLLGFALTSNMAAGSVSIRAMTIDMIPQSGRGKTYGRFMAVVSLGMAMGPFVGGFLADAVSYAAPFYLCSGLGIISLVTLLPMGYDESQSQLSFPSATSDRVKLLTKPFFILLFIRLLFMFNMNFQRGTLPIFLHENQSLRVSETQIGFYMGLIYFTSALSQLFLGALTDKVGSKKLIVFGLGMSGLSYLSLIYLSEVTPLYLLGIFQGVFFASAETSMMIYVMTIIPEGSTGKAMGAYGFFEDLGGIVSSSSLGIIYDRLGPIFSILSVSTVLMCNAGLSAFLLNKDDPDPTRQEIGAKATPRMNKK